MRCETSWHAFCIFRGTGIRIVKPSKRCHRRPVILVHGFLSSPRAMGLLKSHLRRRLGREVYTVAIGWGRHDLRECADEVYAKVSELAGRRDFEYADVVGHSMGGLVAIYLLKRIDRGRLVRSVITLGTPHRGAPLARLGVLVLGRISAAVWQMLPGSDFLRELLQHPMPRQSRIVSIVAERDWIVPGASADAVDGAGYATVRVGDAGHTTLLYDRSVLELVGSSIAPDSGTAMSEAA